MKKIAAILLAVIIVSTSFIMAYAADVYTCPTCSKKFADLDAYNACIEGHIIDADAESGKELHKCSTCGKIFEDLDSYNNCVDSHFNNVNYHYDKYVGLTIPELLEELVNIYNKTGATEMAQNLVDKLFDLADKAADSETVSETISALELELSEMDVGCESLSDINCIIDELKQCVASDEEKTEVEVTEAEPPAATGSENIGSVAIFATVSVAAAAAFVTIKSKKQA